MLAYRRILLLLVFIFSSGLLLAQTVGDYRTAANTAWSALTTWERWNGAWVTPTAGEGYPGQFGVPGLVTIRDNNSITLDVSPASSIGALTIEAGTQASTLTFTGTNSLIVDGAVIINSGNGAGDNKTIAVGAGALSCASITMALTNNNNRANSVTISTGTVTVAGDITMDDNATRNNIRITNPGNLNIGGNFLGAAGGGINTVAGSTVNYNGANQTVKSISYTGNLTLSGSGTKDLTNVNTIGENFTMSGSSIAAIASSAFIGGTVTLESGTTFTAGSFTIDVGGDWINNGATIDNSGSLINFFGTDASIGGSNSTTFNDVSITGTGTMTLALETVINGGLSIDAGVAVDLGTIITHTANTLTLGGIGQASGTWGSSSSSASNINNTFFAATSGILNVASANYYSRANGNWNTNTTWSFSPGGPAVGAGIFPTATDIVNIQGGFTVTVTGVNAACSVINFEDNGAANTLNINPGITLDVSGLITIPRTAPPTNATNLNTLAVGAGILNAGSIAFTNGGGGVRHRITISTGTATVTGDITTDNAGASASIIFSGAGTLNAGVGILTTGINGGTLTTFAGSTINYNGAAQTVKAVNYLGNLTLSGSGIKTLQAGTTSIGGNFTISGSATTTSVAALTIGGTVTLGSGTGFTAGVFTHNVAGDWVNNGTTFDNTGSTINFNRAGVQSIGGSSSTTFNNLTLAVSGTKTLGIATFAAGNLSISGTAIANLGAINTHTANTLILGGVNQISGTWGSTTSIAVNTNNTYFSATTGIVTIATTTFYSRANGNWNTNTTWSFSPGGPAVGAGLFPTASDLVSIQGGFTVTVTAAAACASLTFPAVANGNTVNINLTNTLSVSGAITIARPTNGATNTLGVGAGILNAGSIAFTNGGGGVRHQITISTGTVTVTGDITTDNAGASANITFSNTGLLKVGVGLFTTNFVGGSLTPSTGTVDYNAAGNQIIRNFNYSNLKISGSGTKTLTGNTGTSATLTVSANTTLDLSTFNIGNTSNIVLEAGATTAGSTITGTGILTMAGPLTVNNLGTGTNGAAISSLLALGGAARVFTVADDGSLAPDLTVSGVVSGGGGITKAGAGTLVLSALNTNTGAITINAGILSANTLANVNLASSLGTGAGTSTITIGPAGTLQYTGTGHSSSRPFTISGSGATIEASGSGPMTLSGAISGATNNLVLTGTGLGIASGVIGTTTGSLTKNGNGTWTLSGNNSYTGATTVSAGVLQLGASDRINNTSALIVNGTFDMAGFSETVASISGSGIITSSGASTLTLAAAAGSTTFSGTMVNGTGTLSLSKTGASTQVLSGANTYTGATTITAGTLQLGASGVISDASPINLNGGTLSTGSAAGFTESVGNITLSANSTIALGTGSHSLNFAGVTSFSGGTTLTILGWAGNYGTGVATDGKVFIGNSNLLSSSQLNSIGFFDGTNSFGALQLVTGEIIPSSSKFRYSVNTGFWDQTNTWSATSGGPAGASVPVAGDIVIIENGFTVTVRNDAFCGALNFNQSSSTSATLSISATITLSVSGAITIPRGPAGVINTVNVGAGILNAGSMVFTNGGPGGGGNLRHTVTILTGRVTVSGDITQVGSTGSALIQFTGAGLLQVGGAIITNNNATLTTFAGSTVEYNGAGAQTVGDYPYVNLTLSGGGTKTLQAPTTGAATSASGILTVLQNTTLDLSTLGIGTPTSTVLEGGASTGATITGSSALTLGGNVTINDATGAGTSGATISAPVALGVGGVTRTFTVADDGSSAADLTISGVVTGFASILKAGPGTLSLSNTSNAYTQATTVNAGTLELGSSGVIPNTSNVILAGGTLSTGATAGFSEAINNLTHNVNSTIALGTGSHSLNFAGVTSLTGTLTINGWVGDYNTGVATGGQVFIGTSAVLTLTQLQSIKFFDGVTLFNASQTGAGEIVPTNGTVRYSVATGNWNNPNTWSTVSGGAPGASVPVAGDIVMIENGNNVTLTADAACANLFFNQASSASTTLTINAGFTLTVSGGITLPRGGGGVINTIAVGAGTLNAGDIAFTNANVAPRHFVTITTGTVNVSGNVTQVGPGGSSSARITFTGAGLLQLGGTIWSPANGTLTTFAGSTVEYNGADQTVQTHTYLGNLTLSGSGIKTLQAATTTIGGSLTVSGTASTTTVVGFTIPQNLIIGDGASFIAAGFNLTVAGTTTVGAGTSGQLSISSATGTKLFTGLVTVASGGTWDNSTSNSAVTFRGGITNNGTFTAGTGIHTFNTNPQQLNGILSIPNVTVTGVTLTNNNTLTVDTDLTGNGGLTQATNAVLNLGGTSGITTLTASVAGNTVNYSGNVNQTIKTPVGGQYANLSFNGTTASGIATQVLSSTLSVSGNWVNNGTGVTGAVTGFNPNGGTVIFNGSSTISGSSVTSLNNLQLAASSTLNLPASDVNVSGNIDLDATGTFNPSTGRVVINGSALQAINPNGKPFYTIQVNKGGGSFDISSSLPIQHLLDIQTATTVNSNGNLLILSRGSTTDLDGSIGPIPSGAVVNGAVTMQRYMQPLGFATNRYISVPVSGETATTAFSDDFTIASGSIRYYKESVAGVRNNGFTNQGLTNPLTLGTGYLAFIYNGSSVITWDASGSIYQGSIALPVSYTPSSGGALADGWNLVSNPYASAISWSGDVSKWTKSADISPVVFVTDMLSNSFIPFNYADNSGEGGIIAMGQSFWVKASAASPSLTIHEPAKTSASGGSFYRTSLTPASEQLIIGIQNKKFRDRTYLKINQNATNDFDQLYDGYKLMNESLNISLQDDAKRNLAMHTLSSIPIDKRIPLVIETTEPGEYEILFSNQENFSAASTLYLIDLFEGKSVAVTSGESYKANITEATKLSDRFYLSRNPEVSGRKITDWVQVYPNPVKEKLTIRIPADEVVIIKMIDNQGREFLSTQIKGSHEIDMRDYAPGMYVLRLITKDEVLVHKIIR